MLTNKKLSLTKSFWQHLENDENHFILSIRHQISCLGPGPNVHAVEGGVVPPSLLDTVAPSGGLKVDLETKFYFQGLSQINAVLKHLKSDASSGHVDPAGAVAGPWSYVIIYLISSSHPMVSNDFIPYHPLEVTPVFLVPKAW